jgi:hypothetical protein
MLIWRSSPLMAMAIRDDAEETRLSVELAITLVGYARQKVERHGGITGLHFGHPMTLEGIRKSFGRQDPAGFEGMERPEANAKDGMGWFQSGLLKLELLWTGDLPWGSSLRGPPVAFCVAVRLERVLGRKKLLLALWPIWASSSR